MPDRDIYTVGWICAIQPEHTAASMFFEKKHDRPALPAGDENSYVFGEIGGHNVVIATLPAGGAGSNNAATVARDMARTFRKMKFGLMVGGGGGGAPSETCDIRLGDVVVGVPGGKDGGILQYDYGKSIQNQEFLMTGHLNQSPRSLLGAIVNLQTRYDLEEPGYCISTEIERVLENKSTAIQMKYRRPATSTDRLYESSYVHKSTKQNCESVCTDPGRLIKREKRIMEGRTAVHCGRIASANQVMRNAEIRDRLSAMENVLCFEMEAAGLMNNFPCLVIRGISDYSDTHKNDDWQGYSAMASAAYAKHLLHIVPPDRVERETTVYEMTQEENNIISWLKAPNVSDNLVKAHETCHPGSGKRLIESETYQKWKEGQKSFLWLYGIPGCGKTILTSAVMKDLQDKPTLLYFYFDFTDSDKQQFRNTIPSLLWQLYYKNESTRRIIKALHASCTGEENRKAQPSMKQLQEAFQETIQHCGETWIVLDALDECTTRDALLSWLQDLRNAETNIHILVTSRPMQDVTLAIESFTSSTERTPITDDLMRDDIRNYVRARLKQPEFNIWKARPEVRRQIESTLVEKADGMFRWVSCQLSSLKQCRDPITLRKALGSLPKTLDETYALILDNIPLEYIDHTRRILQFLAYAEHPLQLDEAVDAIAVNVTEGIQRKSRFDPMDRMPVPEEIIGYCAGLVILVRRHHWYYKDREGVVLQLAHFSVRDYLTSDRVKGQNARFLKESFARTSIAEVCLSYLLVPDPREYERYDPSEPYLLDDDLAAFIGEEYPFARFAAHHWKRNALQGEGNVPQLLKKLCMDANQWGLCGSICKLEDYFFSFERIAEPIYYASLYGMLWWVQVLIDEGPNVARVNDEGGEQNYPLHAATVKGHNEVVQLLLSAGANVNIRSNCGDHALSIAIREGQADTVQILLSAGANANTLDSYGFEPIHAAIEHGHANIVRDLLSAGAHFDDEHGFVYILDLAIEGGDIDIMQLLLNDRMAFDLRSRAFDRALRTAQVWGHNEIVQLLLDRRKSKRKWEEGPGI